MNKNGVALVVLAIILFALIILQCADVLPLWIKLIIKDFNLK